MAETFPDAVIGLSDHTTSNLACFAGVALGASILERHFTDRMDRPGPDIVNSMDPIRLKELIIGSEEIRKMLGGTKVAAEEEQVTIDFAFATVVSIAEIKAGDEFTEKNMWVKRPGTGKLAAKHYYEILGKRSSSDIPADVHIEPKHIKDTNII